MTRTDAMASSRPETSEAKGTTGPRRLRRLAILPVLALLALALFAPAGALAAGSSSEPTSGYNNEPEKPKSETEPAKETSTGTSTSTSGTAPSSEKASSLPFTGFDLRWSVAAGVLLLATAAAGFHDLAGLRPGRVPKPTRLSPQAL